MIEIPHISPDILHELVDNSAHEAAHWAAGADMAHPSTGQLTGGIRKFINGPVLNTAQWAMSVNTVHPSMHRLLNATFLTAGLYGGRTVMNLLTGETPGGEAINKEDVPLPLKPLHGVLKYNHFSDNPGERWMKVMDLWFPAALGAVGAVAGSHVFALDQAVVQQAKANLKAPEHLTLDKAENSAIMLQSRPWRVLSGVTSLFGSASGFQLVPGPTNYGSTLGAGFLGTVPRNKLHTPYMPWLQEFMNDNIASYPYGPASMLPRLKNYLVHNPEKNPKEAQKMAYAILEPWFGEHATPKHVEAFVSELQATRNKFLKEGGVPENLQAQLDKELGAIMQGVGFEKTLQKIGLDPSEATVGHNGFVEQVSRWMGSARGLDKLEENYRNAYFARNKLHDGSFVPAPHEPHPGAKIAGMAVAAGSASALGAGVFHAKKWHKQDNDALLRRVSEKNLKSVNPLSRDDAEKALLAEQKDEVEDLTFAERVAREKARHQGDQKPSSLLTMMNDKPLGLLEWGADALNSPETYGMHRVYCAGGLSLGGFIGMKMMDVLTGRTLSNAPVPKEKVPDFLQGLYKKMAYNPHSDHPHDRWGMVMHFLVPAVMATTGVVAASSYFFKDKVKKAQKAEYIDDFEVRATMDQAKPWTGLTALTSLFATPSGFSYLPIPMMNYGASLGTRFNLSAGRKVILPVVGEAWTSTASRFPFGPPKLIEHMIKYSVNNPDAHPDQLEEMAIGVLKPWFENVTDKQIEEFIRKVEEDRNKFLACGGIPENMKHAAEKEMIKHFKGAGLEQTLRDIGLDPSEAYLGNNGLSGKIAEHLGGADALAKTRSAFKQKYAERVRDEQATTHAAPSTLEELNALLKHGELLDKVEAIVKQNAPEIAEKSIALRQEAADAYEHREPQESLTAERIKSIMGALSQAYQRSGDTSLKTEVETLMKEFDATSPTRNKPSAHPPQEKYAHRIRAHQTTQDHSSASLSA